MDDSRQDAMSASLDYFRAFGPSFDVFTRELDNELRRNDRCQNFSEPNRCALAHRKNDLGAFSERNLSRSAIQSWQEPPFFSSISVQWDGNPLHIHRGGTVAQVGIEM